MSMDLRKELLAGTKKIGVWGIGHIGYSSMSHYAERGVRCIGYDVNQQTVETVNRGESPVFNMDYWLGFTPGPLYTSGVATATADWRDLIKPDVAVHFVCVPTERGGRPDLGPLMETCRRLATYKGLGVAEPPLMIIESTLTPGTIDKEVVPFFEDSGLRVGKDLLIGCSPRRDFFTSPEKSMRYIHRVYGGADDRTAEAMRQVLSLACQNLVKAPNHYYAEAVKSVENAYRQLGVTLAFELSRAYPNLDMRKVLELVGTKWNMETYYPSLGVGGYCLPVSSYYVLQGAERPDELGLLKRTIVSSEAQPGLVADSLVKRGCKNVGILGLSYMHNIRVHTMSPTLEIAQRLSEAGVQVKVNDPLYSADEVRKITKLPYFAYPKGLGEFDAVLVVDGHRQYHAIDHGTLLDSLGRCKLVLDNAQLWGEVDFASRGIEYHATGDAGWLGDGRTSA